MLYLRTEGVVFIFVQKKTKYTILLERNDGIVIILNALFRGVLC